MDAAESERVAWLRSLGELLRRLHATPRSGRATPTTRTGRAQQLEQARANLSWCDGTAAGLVELEAIATGAGAARRLIHGDLALDNVLIDADGAMSLIDWAGGGSGDPRHDIALAFENEPEFELTPAALDAFLPATARLRSTTAPVDWFVPSLQLLLSEAHAIRHPRRRRAVDPLGRSRVRGGRARARRRRQPARLADSSTRGGFGLRISRRSPSSLRNRGSASSAR